MTIKLELAWSREESGGRFFVIGDVRDVIHSRAQKMFPLPRGISHGLGLLSTTDASGAGEGILLRGTHALTPPSSAAGSTLDPVPGDASLTTPFFLGWSAETLAPDLGFGTRSFAGPYTTFHSPTEEPFHFPHVLSHAGGASS